MLFLDEFEEGISELAYQVPADDLGLADRFFAFPAPVAVSLKVVRGLQTFSLDGTVRWVVAGECCRCLAPVQQPMETRLRLLVQRREASREELEAYEDQDEVEIVDPGARQVDLAERLRDAIALELPMRIYCRDECKGLCPSCGQDLNAGACECAVESTDPRWEALARFRTPE
ncbi:MAG: DUF177 domain-containing protein [Gemmatimonadota bacterium]